MIAKVVIKTIGRKTLRYAVLSAHREDFQVIVVSDNPSLGILELRDFSISPEQFYTLPKKCGDYGAVAANVGAAMNDAEYTIFLDDDDEFIEGAGEYMRSKLKDKKTDLWIPGLDFGDFQLCKDSERGFVPGNVGMVTYRTTLLQRFPMQYLGPKGEIDHYDFFHASACVQHKKAMYDWYGKLLYKIRPRLPGTNGRGD